MKRNQRASLPLNLKFRLQKIKFWNWILNDECFVVPLFWDVWSSFLSILFYFIWISPFRKKNLIDFCSPLKYIYIYIFFLKFEIWNLEFETFFLKKDTLCSWSSLKAYFSSFKIEFFLKLMSSIFENFFYSSLFIFLSFKRTKQKFYLIFFFGSWLSQLSETWVDSATQVK